MYRRFYLTRSTLIGSIVLLSILLGGCVHTIPMPIHIDTPAASESAPAPEPIWAHADEVAHLQKEINILRQQVAEIQLQQTALSQLLSARAALGTPSTEAASTTTSRLQQAQQQYRAGLYAQAIRNLAGSDSGGNGNAEAQSSMFLLLQSHYHLNNCESVINIGNRFTSRFGRNPLASEALWLMGQCQWRMQQQDIARDTWRKIIRSYPDSDAAKRAAPYLK